MALQDYIWPENKWFEVVCRDQTSVSTDITEGETYIVRGSLQGFFIMKNDKGEIGKYHRNRFVVKEEPEPARERNW